MAPALQANALTRQPLAPHCRVNKSVKRTCRYPARSAAQVQQQQQQQQVQAVPAQQQWGASSTQQLATLSRGQLLKGSLLAAGGLLLGTATPLQAATAAEEAAAAAVEAAAAFAADTTAAAASPAAQTFSTVLLRTLADCQLAVSVYPTFSYNAAGGGGSGTVLQGADGLLHLSFDPSTLDIPPINYQHAAIIGIPVPPPLNIAIVPKKLEGTLDPATGRVDLDFLASFEFTAGPLYRAAPLTVATTLTTESSQGPLRSGTGSRLAGDGRARLVGVARVPPTDDALLNTFLMLPTDALAVLSAELSFS